MIDFFLNSGIFGIAIIVGSLVHCFVGALFVLVTRSRRVAILFTAAAFLPLLVGLSGSYIGIRAAEESYRQKQLLMKPETKLQMEDLLQVSKQEAMIPAYLGGAASVILLCLGVCGIAMTKRPDQQA